MKAYYSIMISVEKQVVGKFCLTIDLESYLCVILYFRAVCLEFVLIVWFVLGLKG